MDYYHHNGNHGGDTPRTSGGSGNTTATQVQRRHAQIHRAVEGVTLPAPIRIPSRLGQTSCPGSASGTPRMGTPRMGTPRLGTPRPGYNQARARRRKATFAMQVIITLCIFILGVKQLMSIFKKSNRVADPMWSPSLPQHEDQTEVHIREFEDDEDYSQDDETNIDLDHIINARHGVISEDQQHRLELLADALLTEHDNVDILLFPKESTRSGMYAHPTTGVQGKRTSHYYRFTNVKIQGGKILFYGGGSMSQPKRMLYDVSTGNSTMPKAPTSILVRTKNMTERQHIDVEYLAENRATSACTEWIEEPALLIHSRYPENMWHAWVGGFISTFQTSRELGYLDLFMIDESGMTTKLGTGLPGDECPVVADLLTGSVKPAKDCLHRKDGSSFTRKCNTEDTWCQPGVWPGNPEQTYRKEGPAMIYSHEAIVDTEWSSLYSAMSSTVRSLDAIEGFCLRNFVVGTSKSLSFEEGAQDFDDFQRGTVESLAHDLDDFVKFSRSAQQRLKMNNAIEFLGYPDINAEKLRKGIRLGQGGIIDRLYPEPPKSVWDSPWVKSLDMTMEEDKNSLLRHPWVFSYQGRDKTPKSEYSRIRKEAQGYLTRSPLPFKRFREYSPDKYPVVTFITKVRSLSRSILNERHILRYIYWNYEVRLRVTDLSEHVDAVADIFSETDVLIGCHEPGWMQSIFLQPGAVTLQLLPFGWRMEDGSLLRGSDVQNIVHLRQGSHLDWVNPHAEFSFFRRKDFKLGGFIAHPGAVGNMAWSKPDPDNVHPAWLYANTYADMNHLKAYIDVAMEAAGIPKLPRWKIDELKAIRQQTKDQMPERMQQDWLEGNLAAAGWEEDDVLTDELEEEDEMKEIKGDKDDEQKEYSDESEDVEDLDSEYS